MRRLSLGRVHVLCRLLCVCRPVAMAATVARLQKQAGTRSSILAAVEVRSESAVEVTQAAGKLRTVVEDSDSAELSESGTAAAAAPAAVLVDRGVQRHLVKTCIASVGNASVSVHSVHTDGK